MLPVGVAKRSACCSVLLPAIAKGFSAQTNVRVQVLSGDRTQKSADVSCLRSEVLRKPATTDKPRLRYAQAFTDLFQL